MQWYRAGLLCGLLLLLPGWVAAEDFVCGDSTKLYRYTPSVDPTKVPTCPASFLLSQIPEMQLVPQAQLYATVPAKHLKVVAGLMVEMTQPEKDAVDLPAQQHAAATAVAKNEIATNEVCANNTLPEITAYWKGPGGKQEQLQATIATLDSAIAAVTAGPAKNAIQAAREAIAAHMTMFINDSELQWRYLCSRTFVRP